jgi:hypothetical protein
MPFSCSWLMLRTMPVSNLRFRSIIYAHTQVHESVFLNTSGIADPLLKIISYLVYYNIIFHNNIRPSSLLRSPTIFSLVFLAVVVQWGYIEKFVFESWLCPFFFTWYNQFCL